MAKRFYILITLFFVFVSSLFSNDWHVCFGSFRILDNAVELKNNLEKEGIETSIVQHDSSSSILYRVLDKTGSEVRDEARNHIKDFSAASLSSIINLNELWICIKDASDSVIESKTPAAIVEKQIDSDVVVYAAPVIEEPKKECLFTESTTIDELIEILKGYGITGAEKDSYSYNGKRDLEDAHYCDELKLTEGVSLSDNSYVYKTENGENISLDFNNDEASYISFRCDCGKFIFWTNIWDKENMDPYIQLKRQLCPAKRINLKDTSDDYQYHEIIQYLIENIDFDICDVDPSDAEDYEDIEINPIGVGFWENDEIGVFIIKAKDEKNAQAYIDIKTAEYEEEVKKAEELSLLDKSPMPEISKFSYYLAGNFVIIGFPSSSDYYNTIINLLTDSE